MVIAGANVDMEKGPHGIILSLRVWESRCLHLGQCNYFNSLYINRIDAYTLVLDSGTRMKKDPSEDANHVHVWLVLGKAFHAMTKFTMAGIQESGLGDSDFRVLEA